MLHLYTPQSIETQSSVGPLIQRLGDELSCAIAASLAAEPALATLQLSAAHCVVLAHLYDGNARSAGDLCKLTGYDAGAMSRLLFRLEKQRLIHRRRREDDRRAVAIELATSGINLVPTLRARVVDVLNRFLAGFTGPEVAQMECFLQRMLGNARFCTPSALVRN